MEVKEAERTGKNCGNGNVSAGKWNEGDNRERSNNQNRKRQQKCAVCPHFHTGALDFILIVCSKISLRLVA